MHWDRIWNTRESVVTVHGELNKSKSNMTAQLQSEVQQNIRVLWNVQKTGVTQWHKMHDNGDTIKLSISPTVWSARHWQITHELDSRWKDDELTPSSECMEVVELRTMVDSSSHTHSLNSRLLNPVDFRLNQHQQPLGLRLVRREILGWALSPMTLLLLLPVPLLQPAGFLAAAARRPQRAECLEQTMPSTTAGIYQSHRW